MKYNKQYCQFSLCSTKRPLKFKFTVRVEIRPRQYRNFIISLTFFLHFFPSLMCCSVYGWIVTSVWLDFLSIKYRLIFLSKYFIWKRYLWSLWSNHIVSTLCYIISIFWINFSLQYSKSNRIILVNWSRAPDQTIDEAIMLLLLSDWLTLPTRTVL